MPFRMRARFVTSLALVAACSRAGAGGDAALPYRVAIVDVGDVRVIVEETGVVEPERQIVVKSPISGVVERLVAREGDSVRAGQVLARIVPDIAQANTFSRIRSEIATTEIARDNAKREFERAQQLAASGSITQADLDQRRADYEHAENQVRASREQLRLIEQSGVTAGGASQWARITAPAGGVIILRGVEEGETVVGGTSAFGGGTELFTIADLSALRIKAAVNEVDIGKVSEDDRVALSVDAFPDDTVEGTVRLVPPAARLEGRVRVFDVEIAVGDAAAAAGILRPGMTANVRIAGPTRTAVVRVPVQAVFIQEGQTLVFRVRGGVAERVPVTLGLSDLSSVEVIDGVQEGDTVAVEDPLAAAERAGTRR